MKVFAVSVRGSGSKLVRIFATRPEAESYVDSSDGKYKVEEFRVTLPIEKEVAMGNACSYVYVQTTKHRTKGDVCGAMVRRGNTTGLCAKHQSQIAKRRGTRRKMTLFNYFIKDVSPKIQEQYKDDPNFSFDFTFKIAGTMWRGAEGERWRLKKYLKSHEGSKEELMARWEAGEKDRVTGWKGEGWIERMNEKYERKRAKREAESEAESDHIRDRPEFDPGYFSDATIRKRKNDSDSSSSSRRHKKKH